MQDSYRTKLFATVADCSESISLYTASESLNEAKILVLLHSQAIVEPNAFSRKPVIQ